MEEKIEGITSPQESKEKERSTIEKIIQTTEQGIDELESKLEQLLPDKRHEVQWLPNNLQDRIKALKDMDENGEFKEKIGELEKHFEDIISKFELDRRYFNLKEKE